jgi:hypothetical protein
MKQPWSQPEVAREAAALYLLMYEIHLSQMRGTRIERIKRQKANNTAVTWGKGPRPSRRYSLFDNVHQASIVAVAATKRPC